jgi:RHS repeat-associated protein
VNHWKGAEQLLTYTEYVYDDLNRLTQIYNRKGNGTLLSSFVYTLGPAGQREYAVETLNGVQRKVDYVYDELSRLTGELVYDATDTLTRRVTYTYDQVGNRQTMTVEAPCQETILVTYTYDGQDRLRTETRNRTAYAALCPGTPAYAAACQIRAGRTAGTLLSGYGIVTLLAMLTPVLLVGAGLCGSPPGRRARRRRLLHVAVAMFFVPLFMVGPESVEQWWAQHLCRAAYGACDPQTPSLDTLTYEYDGNGNLTRTLLNGVAQAEYVYDAQNRLAAYDSTPAAIGGEVAYAYDAAGVRIGKTAGGQTTRFIVDEQRGLSEVLAEVDAGTGVVTVRYTHGDDLLRQTRWSGTGTPGVPPTDDAWCYQYDGQGSTRQLTSAPASGLPADVQVTSNYAYDAFGADLTVGAPTGGTPPAENLYRYTGEQADGQAGAAGTGFYYLRARYYDPATGRFVNRDPLEGSNAEPMSLHKYLYANADPVNRSDPSGLETLGSVMVTVGIQAMLGAVLAVGFNAASNYAQGKALFAGWWQAALIGAALGPAVMFCPFLGLLLAAYGLVASANLVASTFRNPNATWGQKAMALTLLAASVFGAYASVKNVKMNGFWRAGPRGSPEAAAMDELHVQPEGQPQAALRSVGRLSQDAAVDPVAPAANNGSGTIGKNPNQATALQRFLSVLQREQATDIRVNQQQVNVSRVRVGTNRPDLQFTHNGRRWYIEWDTSGSPRGIPHGERIMANDPDGMTLLFTLD